MERCKYPLPVRVLQNYFPVVPNTLEKSMLDMSHFIIGKVDTEPPGDIDREHAVKKGLASIAMKTKDRGGKLKLSF